MIFERTMVDALANHEGDHRVIVHSLFADVTEGIVREKTELQVSTRPAIKAYKMPGPKKTSYDNNMNNRLCHSMQIASS